MNERLKYLGRRQELETERKALEIRRKGLIDNLRDAMDPLAKIEDLKIDCIGQWSAELAEVAERYRKVVADLKEIRDLIGE